MSTSAVTAVCPTGLDLDAWRIGRLDGVEEVPSGWSIRRLTEVAKLESGHTPDRSEPVYWDGDIGWLSLHDVGNLTSGLIESTKFSVTQAGIDNSSARVLPAGTVCLSRTATVGECVLLGKAMATSQDFANYVCGPLVDNRYLLQLFRFMKPVWTRLSGGSVHRTVYMPDFKKLAILLPPLPEQQKIARILSSVDEAIQATEAVIEQTKKVKQGVMNQLLTKGIGHTRFKQTEIGEIPEGWEVMKLADTALRERSSFVIGPFGSDLVATDYRNIGVPVIFVRDVKAEKINWVSGVYLDANKANELKAHSVKGGDVVITKMGLPPGIAARYPDYLPEGIVTADIIRLRPDQSKYDSHFLSCMLNGAYGRLQVKSITGGQTRPKLTLRDFKALSFPLPPLEEQQEISGAIGRIDCAIDCAIEEKSTLMRMKAALMADLMTGRKRVTV